MKIYEVPQDKGEYRDRDKSSKIVYAVDNTGTYASVNSDGWEVEHTATMQAWSQAELELEEVLQSIKQGKLSPIAYFMKKNLMDVAILAKHVGKWKWQVKKHLKPSGFSKMSKNLLQKYAEAFNTTIEAIKSFNPDTAIKH